MRLIADAKQARQDEAVDDRVDVEGVLARLRARVTPALNENKFVLPPSAACFKTGWALCTGSQFCEVCGCLFEALMYMLFQDNSCPGFGKYASYAC